MLDTLRSFAGKARVLLGAEAPAAVAGVAPIGIAYPRTVDEVGEIVRWCASEGVPIEPSGGGTWLSSGNPPANPPLIVSVRELNEVIEYEPADLVVTAQAGVALTELQHATEKHLQRLALDPPAAKSATIGGLIATASAGPQRYAYGTPRDHVLGLQIVTGDARVLNLGGKVVKNVAGYDLTRLLVGSRGTLGIITQVHVRLRPVLPEDVTFEVLAAPVELIELAHACRSAAFEPAALELVIEPPPAPSALLIRVQGNAEVIEAAESAIRVAAGTLEVVRASSDSADRRWKEIARAAIDATFSARIAALPTEAVRLLRLAERVRGCFPEAVLFMHAGNGIARVHASALPVSMAALTEALQSARTELTAVRGSVTVPVAPAELHNRFACLPLPDNELRLMQELKRKFDPAGILAPGRFVI